MLDRTIAELKSRRQQIVSQINGLQLEAAKLGKAITVLSKLSGPVKAKPAKRRVKMSAAGKARIRAAQKKRWAEWKKRHQAR